MLPLPLPPPTPPSLSLCLLHSRPGALPVGPEEAAILSRCLVGRRYRLGSHITITTLLHRLAFPVVLSGRSTIYYRRGICAATAEDTQSTELSHASPPRQLISLVANTATSTDPPTLSSSHDIKVHLHVLYFAWQPPHEHATAEIGSMRQCFLWGSLGMWRPRYERMYQRVCDFKDPESADGILTYTPLKDSSDAFQPFMC